MRLFAFEIKKSTHTRFMAALFAIIMVSSAAISFWGSENAYDYPAITKAYWEYLESPGTINERLDDLRALIVENINDDTFSLPKTYSSSLDDYVVLSKAVQRAEWMRDHQKRCNSVSKNAEQRAAELIELGFASSGAAVSAQRKLSNRYQLIINAVDEYDGYSYGYDDYFNNDYLALIIAFFSITFSVFLFMCDRSLGADLLLSACKKGRRNLRLTKCAVSAAVSSVGTVLICAFSLSVVRMKVGLSNIMAPIQSLPGFEYVPSDCSILVYLVNHTLLRALSAVLISLSSGLLAVLLRRYYSTIIAEISITAVFTALYFRKYVGTPPVPRFLNPVFLIEATQLTTFFRSVALLGASYDIVCLSVGLAVFSVVILVLLTVFIPYHSTVPFSINKMPAIKKTKLNEHWNRRLFIHTLFGYEAVKMRPLLLAIPIIICCAASFNYQYQTCIKNNDYGEALYHSYIDAVCNMSAEEREQFINSERSRLNNILNSYESVKADFEANLITRSDFNGFLNTYYEASASSIAFRRAEANHDAAARKSIQLGIEVKPVYDTGMLRLGGSGCDWFLVAALIILCSDVFPIEFKNSTNSIIRPSKHGRFCTAIAKIGYCGVSGGITAAVFAFIRIAAIGAVYEYPGFGSIICGIELFSRLSPAITVSMWFILTIVSFILFGLICGCVICILSLLCHYLSISITASVLFLAIPEIIVSTRTGVNAGLSVSSLLVPIRFFSNHIDSIAPSGLVMVLLLLLLTSVGVLSVRRLWCIH